MKRKLVLTALLLVVVLAVTLYRSLVFVDETESVIVTQFGRPVSIHDTAGLRWKLPYQSVVRFDSRMQIYDPRPSEFLSAEKKNIDLDFFVCWRVGDPLHFFQKVNDLTGAEELMHDIVWANLGAEIGSVPLDALVSTDPTLHRLDEIIEGVAESCRKSVREQSGIEIVDVRVKRIGLPSQVRDSVFERMRSERSGIAEQYRSEGEGQAQEIRADADAQRSKMLADAEREAEIMRGEAEAEAIRVYADAHQKDPEFYRLVRTLEAYRKVFDEKTTILLSGDSGFLKYFSESELIDSE